MDEIRLVIRHPVDAVLSQWKDIHDIVLIITDEYLKASMLNRKSQ